MGKKPYEFDILFSDIEKDLQDRIDRVEAIPFKVCSKCKETKPIYKFSKDKRNSDGRVSVCKECRSKEALEYYYENRDRILIRYKNYQENHKKERRAYFQNYRIEHEKHLQKMAKKWYRKNRKRIKKRNLEYYEENKLYCQAIRELWRENHKEKIKRYNREYQKLKVSLK